MQVLAPLLTCPDCPKGRLANLGRLDENVCINSRSYRRMGAIPPTDFFWYKLGGRDRPGMWQIENCISTNFFQ